MPDDSANLDHLPYQHPLRVAARHREEARLREETIAQHQANPAVQEWLKQFRDDGRGFLDWYADKRADSLITGRRVYERERDDDRELMREGQRRIWEIQQRKLFEMQVRWRAGQPTPVDAPTRTIKHFSQWGYQIKKCTWLPPITAAEVEEYCAYLISPACFDADPDVAPGFDWQDYDSFKTTLQLDPDGPDPAQARWQACPRYPGWYAWCDRRAGPPNLLLDLPNLRGFQNAAGSYDRDEEEDEPAPVPAFRPTPVPPPPPPHAGPPVLGYADFAALTNTLMRAVETPEMQRYHQACLPPPAQLLADDEAARRENKLNEAGHEAGRRLAEMPERHPIKAAADWREALYHTWLDRRKQLLAVEVRAAFAKYQARLARPPRPHPF